MLDITTISSKRDSAELAQELFRSIDLVGTKVGFTGGSGDLGQLVCPIINQLGGISKSLDIATKTSLSYEQESVSILDRRALHEAFRDVGIVIHSAALHGIHEFRGSHSNYDFWDLNVTGTFNVMQEAAHVGAKGVVFISSTSVDDTNSIYGLTKRIAEQVAQEQASVLGLQLVILRPRAFIPSWNKEVYRDFSEFAAWYWKGGVHIADVAQATLKATYAVLSGVCALGAEPLTIDGRYEYRKEDMSSWDSGGPGTTFRCHFAEYEGLAKKYELSIEKPPRILGSERAERILGYKASYGTRELLEELNQFDANYQQGLQNESFKS